MKTKIMNTLFILLTFAFLSCNTNEPENTDKLILTVEDVSCTEAWLKISEAKGSLITLKRDEKEIMQFKLTGTDTVVLDNSLLPNKAYYYEALVNNNEILSNKISVTTMDTTSHNFTWQTFIVGNPLGGSNWFNDVAILDKDNIWVAGRYFIKDSLQMFNAIHWNGSDWEYKRIQFYTICGQEDRTPFITKSLFPFGANNFMINAGDQVATISGGKQTKTQCLPNSYYINKMWISQSNELIAVGNYGNITSYDGKTWTEIESGTEMDIQDVWGITDKNTGEETILCVASNIFTADGNKIIRIKNDKAEEISNDGIPPYYYSSVWFKSDKIAYITGNDTYVSYNFLNETGWTMVNPRITSYYSNCIRGIDYNDIILCGSNGDIAHFNGYSWKDYLNNPLPEFYGQLYSVDIKGNTICAVGSYGQQAIIILGKRN